MKDIVSIVRSDCTITWPSCGTAEYDVKMITGLMEALGPVKEQLQPVERVFDQKTVFEIWHGGYRVGFRRGQEERTGGAEEVFIPNDGSSCAYCERTDLIGNAHRCAGLMKR